MLETGCGFLHRPSSTSTSGSTHPLPLARKPTQVEPTSGSICPSLPSFLTSSSMSPGLHRWLFKGLQAVLLAPTIQGKWVTILVLCPASHLTAYFQTNGGSCSCIQGEYGENEGKQIPPFPHSSNLFKFVIFSDSIRRHMTKTRERMSRGRRAQQRRRLEAQQRSRRNWILSRSETLNRQYYTWILHSF